MATIEGEGLRPDETFFSRAIGRSRYVVLIAVVAVLLVALSLFLLGTLQALISVWEAWTQVFSGVFDTTDLTVK